jgi:asparagine synthase (glutamine-hydrolysing)
MSRIAGYFSPNGVSPDPSVLQRMADAFNLGGADVATIAMGGFGIAVVERGSSADELRRRVLADAHGVIALDGREATRAAAKRWRDDPIGFVSSLAGEIVAGVHYDADRQTLYFFRDRFGARTFYYTISDGALFFASEPKALLPVRPFSVDREMVARFLSMNYRMWFGRVQTFFEGVSELPIASYATADADTLRTHRYWAPPDSVLPDTVPEDEYVQWYKEELNRVVGAALDRSRRPLFLVSGGLDAPVIAAQAKALTGERVDCCAAVFPGFEAIDESRYIRTLTDEIGSEVLLHEMDPEEFVRVYDELLDRHDQPLLSATYVLFFRLLILATELGYDTVFGGGGGDVVSQGCLEYQPYLLADYARYGEPAYAREIDAWCERVGPFLRYWPGERARMRALINQIVDFERPGVIRNNPDWIRVDRRSFGPALDEVTPRDPPIGVRYGTYRQSRVAEEIFHQAIATHFVEDVNSASVTVAGADPFWDVAFVELGFRLPLRMLLRDGWTKYVVRQAVRGVLPEELRRRADKTGLGLPVSDWFRGGPLADALDEALAAPQIAESGLLNLAFVREAAARHRSGEEPNGDLLWRVFSLCRWQLRWL